MFVNENIPPTTTALNVFTASEGAAQDPDYVSVAIIGGV
jgi:hypothetical protein